jgi:hypothetical protein
MTLCRRTQCLSSLDVRFVNPDKRAASRLMEMQSVDYLRLAHDAREITSAKCAAPALNGRTRTNRCAPASRGLACRRRAVLRLASPMSASALSGPQRDRLRFETWRAVDRKQLRRKRKERPSPPAYRSHAFLSFPRSIVATQALLSLPTRRMLYTRKGQTQPGAFGSIYRFQMSGLDRAFPTPVEND